MKVRTAIFTFACIGLLSTASFGQSTPDKGTPSNLMGGMGSQSPVIGSESPGTGSGMGSHTPGMGSESLTIQGELLRVQDELYVVKDASGQEVALHVDQSTQKTGEVKEGDQIKAEVNQDGHVLKLEKADESLQ